MEPWRKQIQDVIDQIDACIKSPEATAVTLRRVAERLGYSEGYISHRFREVTGMQFREYLSARRLSFAFREVRDTRRSLLEIALDYGFSSHEAFTRAFKDAYGVTPSEYRRKPTAVALRTILRPYDCYLTGREREAMHAAKGEVTTYFVSIPAHKFLHVRNYESIGYWDFWQKQSRIPGQDCETVCGLLSSIPHKLDDLGGDENDAGSGQLMAFVNEPEGRICSWGIPLAECYGVRLPADYAGPVPEQMQLMDVPEGEYIVFEHGPFDFATENALVESRIEQAMKVFDYASSGYSLDMTQGRVFYFYHDAKRYWKYVRPVRRNPDPE